jgi:hypothetical protein
MRRFLTFRVSTLLLAMVTLAVSFAWWHDREELRRELEEGRQLRQVLRQGIQHYEQRMIRESWFHHQLAPHVDTFTTQMHEHLSAYFGSDEGKALSEEINGSPKSGVTEKAAKLTKHKNPWVRAWAVRYLSNLPGTAAIPQFETALEDDEEAVRWAGFVGLEALGPEALPAVPSLRRVAKGPPSKLAVGALALLLRFDTPGEIVEQLLGVIEEGDNATRAFAISLLHEVPASAGATAIPKLVELLDDADTDVRHQAIDALGSVGSGDRVTRDLLGRYEATDSAVEREGFRYAIQRIEARAIAPQETLDAFPETTRKVLPTADDSVSTLRAEVDALRSQLNTGTIGSPGGRPSADR